MGKTFEYQDGLAIIPIPELNQTCDRFVEWVEPLLTSQQFSNTRRTVDEFRKKEGEGERLQGALIEYTERNHLKNWTVPFWDDIYLKPRVPLVVEGNVFYLLENKPGDKSHTQVDLATRVIVSALKFKRLIDTEELDVDMQKGSPLCMEQYKSFFSSTRIPKEYKDEIRKSTSGRHIIVLYKENIFTVNVFSEYGEGKTHSQINDELEYISSTYQGREGQGIGLLTSMERDEWAEAREDIIKINSRNKEAIKKIETAIFAVCIDEDSPDTLKEVSKMMLHGNGRNRWFDKSLQFIISKNGYMGINMEHAGMDGSTLSRFIKYIYDDNTISPIEYEGVFEKPENLQFILNKDIKKILEKTTEQFNDIVSNNATRVIVFDEFGTNEIKTCKVSPDAFVQVAIQLAQYKLFGKCYSQYEAVMTRKFLQGRIEVMYSLSKESIAFIESMTAESCDKDEKKKLLIKAAQKHIERIKECQEGRGVDTHLIALHEMYEGFGMRAGMQTLPELFKDAGYKTLTHSTICTSTTSPHGLQLAGWGPVVEDGFAIRYIKYEKEIRFNVVSRKHMEKKLDKLILYIKESLLEMSELMGS